MTPKFYIAELIAKYLSGTLTRDEEQCLNEWRISSSGNEELFQKLCNSENLRNHYTQSAQFDKKEGWELLDKRMRLFRRRKLIFTISRYAAVLVIPAVVSFLLFNMLKDDYTIAEQVKNQTVQILPGEKRAILTLDSGETVDLKKVGETTMQEKDGTAIILDSAKLNYKLVASPTKSNEIIYNKVEVPHGGEYSLILSDGTRVYLNSLSSLRFPVSFQGNRREVELEGEAYFDVKPGSEPFIVKYNNVAVEVLGTTFNVSAYPYENSHTTLVDGSVRVSMGTGAKAVLKPSEQATIKSGSSNLDIREVDTSLYTSWINGKINFKDERLEDIMIYLSRWYDMSVFYSEPSVKDLRFGCNINRYKDIIPFLELLEQTEKVQISINGKNITFRHNN